MFIGLLINLGKFTSRILYQQQCCAISQDSLHTSFIYPPSRGLTYRDITMYYMFNELRAHILTDLSISFRWRLGNVRLWSSIGPRISNIYLVFDQSPKLIKSRPILIHVAQYVFIITVHRYTNQIGSMNWIQYSSVSASDIIVAHCFVFQGLSSKKSSISWKNAPSIIRDMTWIRNFRLITFIF
jgi:hypothetical protein